MSTPFTHNLSEENNGVDPKTSLSGLPVNRKKLDFIQEQVAESKRQEDKLEQVYIVLSLWQRILLWLTWVLLPAGTIGVIAARIASHLSPPAYRPGLVIAAVSMGGVLAIGALLKLVTICPYNNSYVSQFRASDKRVKAARRSWLIALVVPPSLFLTAAAWLDEGWLASIADAFPFAIVCVCAAMLASTNNWTGLPLLGNPFKLPPEEVRLGIHRRSADAS